MKKLRAPQHTGDSTCVCVCARAEDLHLTEYIAVLSGGSSGKQLSCTDYKKYEKES
jgi:hypothetical protein